MTVKISTMHNPTDGQIESMLNNGYEIIWQHTYSLSEQVPLERYVVRFKKEIPDHKNDGYVLDGNEGDYIAERVVREFYVHKAGFPITLEVYAVAYGGGDYDRYAWQIRRGYKDELLASGKHHTLFSCMKEAEQRLNELRGITSEPDYKSLASYATKALQNIYLVADSEFFYSNAPEKIDEILNFARPYVVVTDYDAEKMKDTPHAGIIPDKDKPVPGNLVYEAPTTRYLRTIQEIYEALGQFIPIPPPEEYAMNDDFEALMTIYDLVNPYYDEIKASIQYCETCGHALEECECELCGYCGELVELCQCYEDFDEEECSNCGLLPDECECDVIEYCTTCGFPDKNCRCDRGQNGYESLDPFWEPTDSDETSEESGE